ncbi:hypothetical protein YC2023_100489 [Brassica napus]
MKNTQIRKRNCQKSLSKTLGEESRSRRLIASLEIVDDIVRDWSDSLQGHTFDHESWFGSFRLPLGAYCLAFGFGCSLELIVLLNPQLELLCAP